MNTTRNIVIFIGPPGSGKGSLSHLCIEQLKWVQLSTGNLCRKHIAEQTDIGRHIDEALREGKLIDDHVITQMVSSWLVEQQKHNASVILDGYPRTVAQAEALSNLIKNNLKEFNLHVVRLSISDDHVVMRLGGRAVCRNKNCQAVYSILRGSSHAPNREMECDRCSSPLIRRTDDEYSAIKERLKTYYKHENDLLDFYKNAGVAIKQVHVEKPLHEIFNEFKHLFDMRPV